MTNVVRIDEHLRERTKRQIRAWNWKPPTQGEWRDFPVLTRVAYRALKVDRLGDADVADFVLVADALREAAEQFKFLAAVCEAGASRILDAAAADRRA
jgi:hypothetical protein